MDNFAPKNGHFLTKNGFEQLKKNRLVKIEIFLSQIRKERKILSRKKCFELFF